MHSHLVIFFCVIASFTGMAQDGYGDVLTAGVEAASKFTDSYYTPVAEAATYNLSSGWYTGAQVIEARKFKFSLKGNAAFASDESKSFLLDPLVYQDIIQDAYNNSSNIPASIEVSFSDGGVSPRNVATAFGENNPDESLVITSRDQNTGLVLSQTEIDLPQGLGASNVDFLPSAFVQFGYGLGHGFEVKARLFPPVAINDVKSSLYGIGLQWQLNAVDPREKSQFPFDISLFGGYTKLNGEYNIEDGIYVEGSDQRIALDVNSIVFSGVVSTRFTVFNIYGGLSYITGNSQTDVLGTYTLRSNSVLFPANTTVKNPVSVKTNLDDFAPNLGASLKFYFFMIQADYTFAEYDTASVSMSFIF